MKLNQGDEVFTPGLGWGVFECERWDFVNKRFICVVKYGTALIDMQKDSITNTRKPIVTTSPDS